MKSVLALCIALSVVIISGVIFFGKYDIQINKKPSSHTPASLLTEQEARDIAEASCVKGGEVITTGIYNENSRTWWFDANLNATREGCNPACVVMEDTKTADLNWRCTGLRTSGDSPCGIENCHGLDIVCGRNPAKMCTEMYQLGDRCRQFAACEVVSGACKRVDTSQFTSCKNCVEKCQKNFPTDPEKAFACENTCGVKE